jgi:hypothetical protein
MMLHSAEDDMKIVVGYNGIIIRDRSFIWVGACASGAQEA